MLVRFPHSYTTQTNLQLKVCCVHWLCACAQFMRWQEEVTLNTYEMQWTVRYFWHMSNRWDLDAGSSTGTGSGSEGGSLILSTRAISYGSQKRLFGRR